MNTCCYYTKKLAKNSSALAKLSDFMGNKQRKILMKSFGYYPLIWMLHGRGVKNKINHLLKHSLCIVYKENNNSIKNLLMKNNLFTVHHRNIQLLAIELFKFKENLLNITMSDILQSRSLTYNLRSQTDFVGSFVNTRRFSLNSHRYYASKVWNIVLSDIKNVSNLHSFKNKIKKWKLKECHFDLFWSYVSNL